MTEQLDELLDGYARIMPALSAAEVRIAVALWRLLAEGEPVPVGALADRLGDAAGDVTAAVDGVLAGSCQRDERGDIVAFWGLALPQLASPHQLAVHGRVLGAWCAPDTLWLPRVLDATVAVTSPLHGTDETISLVVGPDGLRDISVDGAVVSFVRPVGTTVGEAVPAILSSNCHHQMFFASAAARPPLGAHRAARRHSRVRRRAGRGRCAAVHRHRPGSGPAAPVTELLGEDER
ncbi:organomercurial lyase [Alloactinosynnema sp. L-07]|uniref:organomercurial lyase n=1 Tax=Alloactinosynnema sp. L-07 TaxID=1653480 RepID=UPI0015604AE3|nr:organomercurial lyase [Alloactinosynnema sp. L-07]